MQLISHLASNARGLFFFEFARHETSQPDALLLLVAEPPR